MVFIFMSSSQFGIFTILLPQQRINAESSVYTSWKPEWAKPPQLLLNCPQKCTKLQHFMTFHPLLYLSFCVWFSGSSDETFN